MPRVRPRRIWVGVTIAVIGMAAVMWAMTFGGWRPWLWIGGALIVVGVLAGWRSGILQDIRGRHGARAEAKDVVEGETHTGATASTLLPVSSPPPPDAASVNAGADEGVRLEPPSARNRARFAGTALVVLGLWMVLAPMLLFYPNTGVSNDLILREYTVAGVLVLSGLYLKSPRRPPPVAAIPAVAGAGLLMMVALVQPPLVRSTINESLSGLLAIVLAAAYYLTSRAGP